MKSPDINRVVLLTEYYTKARDNLVKKMSYRAGGIENAEDVVQEAFARGLKYLDSFDPEERMDKWFSSIINNALRDFKKDERRQGMVTDTDKVIELDEAAHTEELVERVLSDIAALKEPAREVIRRFIVLGYTSKEVAQSMDMNIWTIRKAIKQFYQHARNAYE